MGTMIRILVVLKYTNNSTESYYYTLGGTVLIFFTMIKILEGN